MLNYEYPPLGGGAANATKYILKEFSKYPNLKVDLITSSTSKFKVERISDNITIYFLDISKGNENLHVQKNTDLLTYSYKALRLARKLQKENNYDLCHAFFGIPCGYIARKLNIPYIVSLRGSDVPGYSKKYFLLDLLAFRKMSVKIWDDALSVIANSNGLADLARKSSPNQKIGVIPNGIDTTEFTPKKAYHKSTKLKIIAGTRLIQRKGFIYLVRALRGEKNFSLTLIGEGPEKKRLEKEAKKLGVEVNFAGFIEHDKIPSILREHDIYALPSLNEGMSNFTLEAMSSGLPVLITDVGGTKELLDKNGFLIKKNDTQSIKEGFYKFLENPVLIEKMGKNSREIAQRFDWEKVSKKYFLEYEKAIKK